MPSQLQSLLKGVSKETPPNEALQVLLQLKAAAERAAPQEANDPADIVAFLRLVEQLKVTGPCRTDWLDGAAVGEEKDRMGAQGAY